MNVANIPNNVSVARNATMLSETIKMKLGYRIR